MLFYSSIDQTYNIFGTDYFVEISEVSKIGLELLVSDSEPARHYFNCNAIFLKYVFSLRTCLRYWHGYFLCAVHLRAFVGNCQSNSQHTTVLVRMSDAETFWEM